MAQTQKKLLLFLDWHLWMRHMRRRLRELSPGDQGQRTGIERCRISRSRSHRSRVEVDQPQGICTSVCHDDQVVTSCCDRFDARKAGTGAGAINGGIRAAPGEGRHSIGCCASCIDCNDDPTHLVVVGVCDEDAEARGDGDLLWRIESGRRPDTISGADGSRRIDARRIVASLRGVVQVACE